MNHSSLKDKLDRHLTFLRQDENNLALLIKISDMYCELNEMDSAQRYLDHANTIDRKACLASQGLLYLNQNQLGAAKKSFEEALIYSDTPALRYNLGFTHYINADLDEALEVLSPILENEHYPEAELLIARILHRQDALEESISLVENLLEQNPNDAEALGFLSLLYFDMNEQDLAKEMSDKALALNADVYEAKLINILIRLMTQETSVEEIEELLQINPGDSRLWFALGNTYMTQGDLDTAEQTLQKAIDLYPEFYDCYIALAWCQLLNDHLNEAHETYQNAIEIVDTLADAWGGLALVYALSEDFSKTEQLISKANELNPECFLTEIAEIIYMNHTNPAQAKAHLVKALNDTKVPVSEKLALIIEEME
jgi:tetratricopeptide (TPR) repeat protein